MKKELNILLVEDNEGDVRIIKEMLKEQSFMIFNITLAGTLNEAIQKLSGSAFDTILLDLGLPDSFGFETFRKLNVMYPKINAIIILTGLDDTEVGLKAVYQGAQDYIIKGKLDSDKLIKSIVYSNERNRLNIELKTQLEARKETEEELKQSLAFSESLLRTIPFGMDIVDEGGTVLFQSDNLIRIFGEEAIGKKCWELYRDDKKQCTDCPLMHGINIGDTEAYESQGVLGGRIFEINHTGMLYHGKKAMLEIFQDITDRKENEKELVRAKERAEESDKLKTAFLHNISHEIRTPMNAIVGFSALLGEPNVDAQSRQSYIEIILQSSNHLLAIISDIVDISNIEAKLIRIVKNEINLNAKLKSLCDQFILRAAEKKLELICETSLDYSDAFILTDGTKLLQIITNLINNALKFTHTGHIKLGYKVKENFLEFYVSDSGIGILLEYHKKIFDRFYQVQNTISRIYEGTGLGLAISKAYVELFGGTMWLDSEPGRGTTFYFTIPFEQSYSVQEAESDRKIPESQVLPKKKKILIAEDIDSNFKLVKYFLSGTNLEILRAVNGKEAVDKFLSINDIDLILMDIKMPVMDGYTAVKIIRETNATIPIIAQTAYADDKEKAIDCGFSSFISKPFDRKSLLRVLSEFT